MTLTAQQVQNAIEVENGGSLSYSWSNGTDNNVESYEFYGHLNYEKDGATLLVEGVEYPVERVDSYGGMDMGTELWVVFKIGDQLFKKYGAYYSHDGSYWDGSLNEVKPVQKTITVFE